MTKNVSPSVDMVHGGLASCNRCEFLVTSTNRTFYVIINGYGTRASHVSDISSLFFTALLTKMPVEKGGEEHGSQLSRADESRMELLPVSVTVATPMSTL